MTEITNCSNHMLTVRSADIVERAVDHHVVGRTGRPGGLSVGEVQSDPKAEINVVPDEGGRYPIGNRLLGITERGQLESIANMRVQAFEVIEAEIEIEKLKLIF